MYSESWSWEHRQTDIFLFYTSCHSQPPKGESLIIMLLFGMDAGSLTDSPSNSSEDRRSNHVNLDTINDATQQVEVEQRNPTWWVVKILAHAKLRARNFHFCWSNSRLLQDSFWARWEFSKCSRAELLLAPLLLGPWAGMLICWDVCEAPAPAALPIASWILDWCILCDPLQSWVFPFPSPLPCAASFLPTFLPFLEAAFTVSFLVFPDLHSGFKATGVSPREWSRGKER